MFCKTQLQTDWRETKGYRTILKHFKFLTYFDMYLGGRATCLQTYSGVGAGVKKVVALKLGRSYQPPDRQPFDRRWCTLLHHCAKRGKWGTLSPKSNQWVLVAMYCLGSNLASLVDGKKRLLTSRMAKFYLQAVASLYHL